MFVCCECWVLPGRGLCDGLITRPEESYGCLSVVSVVCCQVEVCATGRSLVQRSPTDCGACFVVCDLETAWMRRPWLVLNRSSTPPKKGGTYSNHCALNGYMFSIHMTDYNRNKHKAVRTWNLTNHFSSFKSHNMKCCLLLLWTLNPLTPNDPYRGRTAPLTSIRCNLYIYPTNIGTEYFKHGIYCPFFPFKNAVCIIIVTYLVPVLFTFYIFIQQM